MLSTLIVSAAEVNLTGKYSSEFVNPFKFLEKKKGNASISKVKGFMNATVSTNRESDSFFGSPSFVISKDCSTILKDYLSEDYKMVLSSKNNYTCTVNKAHVDIQYIDDTNTDHIIDVVVDLEFEVNGRTYKSKMNKDLNLEGNNYGISIRTDFKLTYKDLPTTVQQIIEVSIINELVKNKKVQ